VTKEIQTAFHAGEWAPALNARVDLAKYHSAAELMENFFVDYRGGASTRPGTKYCGQAWISDQQVRLIPFQASSNVGYLLEFGDRYIRFYANAEQILEEEFEISNITNGSPGVLTTSTNHDFSVDDSVCIEDVSGMLEANNRCYTVIAVPAADQIELGDLNGVPVDTSAWTAYTSGGMVAKVYTLPSPYLAEDLSIIKFVQDTARMIITHPEYPTMILSIITANEWTLIPAVIGTSVLPPAPSVATTLAAGTVYYAYVVTSVDIGGQESAPSTPATLSNIQDIRSVAGTNRLTWTAATGATSYNVYRATLVYGNAVPSGAAYGYIGNTKGLAFDDTNIEADFTVGVPVSRNPFQGAGVESLTLTSNDLYAAVPIVTIAAAPAGGVTATATATLGISDGFTPVIVDPGTETHDVGDKVNFPNGVVFVVASVDFSGIITAFQPMGYPGSNPGTIATGSTPANPIIQTDPGPGQDPTTVDVNHEINNLILNNTGSGYTSVPVVTFSSGTATATAALQTTAAGYPGVPAIFQQRLALAAKILAPQVIDFSRTGAYFNFDVSDPIQPDDAISVELSSGQLNSIRHMVPMQSGLIVFTNSTNWLINGGGDSAPITPADIRANPQSYIGSSEVPPIVCNFDILYVQAKGSIVRDIAYNFYTNVFTGTDISVLSSHLFYGYEILEWCWAEEPFKLLHAIRSDGTLLTCTFMKEQELIGWTHHNTLTDTGTSLFKSVACITEANSEGVLNDFVYVVVERVINGVTMKWIERFQERTFPEGVEDAWTVDAAVRYDGSPVATFYGASHLAGQTVTGLADGVMVDSFVMPEDGSFTLPALTSKLTIGIQYFPKLKTLALEVGEPTIQGEQKKITKVTARVTDSMWMFTGSTFSNLTAMRDTVPGNIGSQTNEQVTDLVTGDAMTILDPKYSEQGQYCFMQLFPFPATILGVIPTFTVFNRK
jgi:hypothetical protein